MQNGHSYRPPSSATTTKNIGHLQRKLLVLERIINDLFTLHKLTPILERQLEKMEELVAALEPADLAELHLVDDWSRKVAHWWRAYALIGISEEEEATRVLTAQIVLKTLDGDEEFQNIATPAFINAGLDRLLGRVPLSPKHASPGGFTREKTKQKTRNLSSQTAEPLVNYSKMAQKIRTKLSSQSRPQTTVTEEHTSTVSDIVSKNSNDHPATSNDGGDNGSPALSSKDILSQLTSDLNRLEKITLVKKENKGKSSWSSTSNCFDAVLSVLNKAERLMQSSKTAQTDQRLQSELLRRFLDLLPEHLSTSYFCQHRANRPKTVVNLKAFLQSVNRRLKQPPPKSINQTLKIGDGVKSTWRGNTLKSKNTLNYDPLEVFCFTCTSAYHQTKDCPRKKESKGEIEKKKTTKID